MNTFLMVMLAAALLSIALVAQWEVAHYTTGRGKTILTRAVLIIVGVAFGVVSATSYTTAPGVDALLSFAIGFGLVHVPAAVILFVK